MFHCTSQGAVLSLFPQKNWTLFSIFTHKTDQTPKNVHCEKMYIHKTFFFDSYCQNHFCSFGDSVMPLSFNGTFSREWKKERIWKQTFLSLSWLWIVLMITIDPPPERVKIHAGVKKNQIKKILLWWLYPWFKCLVSFSSRTCCAIQYVVSHTSEGIQYLSVWGA